MADAHHGRCASDRERSEDLRTARDHANYRACDRTTVNTVHGGGSVEDMRARLHADVGGCATRARGIGGSDCKLNWKRAELRGKMKDVGNPLDMAKGDENSKSKPRTGLGIGSNDATSGDPISAAHLWRPAAGQKGDDTSLEPTRQHYWFLSSIRCCKLHRPAHQLPRVVVSARDVETADRWGGGVVDGVFPGGLPQTPSYPIATSPLCAPLCARFPQRAARAHIPRRRHDSALATREAGARATTDGEASWPHARSLATVRSPVVPVTRSQKNVAEHADLVYSRYPRKTTRGTGIAGTNQQQLATGSLRHLTLVV
ncbi:hypothetical protein HPB51_019068 [Rhipicephalus microplus]|uniref:Uncharacterized protein n=1 Tax=Rhipicephalus microplus TaxID=6941 RepID=A0A9J6D6Q6_RHIMP|nr:hypothetical protein HPB51_019068 [Rhipicephalus microplus]